MAITVLAPGGTAYWAFRDRTGALLTAGATGALTGLTLQQLDDAENAGCSLLAPGQPPTPTYKAKTDTTNATLAAADFSTALDQTINFTGTLGSGQTITLVASTLIAAVIPGAVAQGAWFKLRIINQGAGAFAWTLTADSPVTWTLNGTMTIGQYMFRDFIVTIAAGGLTGAIRSVGTSINTTT